MSDKVWNNPIDDTTEWSGDSSTNNLPVSGEMVQKFIKDTFKSKTGCIYYDTANNRYIMFADEKTRDLYISNPQENSDLILGVFDAPFNYSAEINLITDSFNAVLKGTKGNYIRFTFDVKNKNGQSVGEDVICTFTFTRGSSKKVINRKYRAGTTVSLNVDDYIEVGTNIITIGITGQTTLAATTVGVTYQIIDLNISDSLDISNTYDSTADANIEIPYSISGSGIKTMEWYLDGVLIPYVKAEDEITEIETSRIKYISIEGLSQGIHNIQYRASITINGEKFYSKILYRDFIVYNRNNNDNIVAVGTEFPATVDIIGANQPLKLYGVSQYITYSLNIGLFNPTYASSTPLEIYVDDALVSTVAMQNGKPITYDLVITSYGEKVIKLKTENSLYTLTVDVEKSETSIEELTQGLALGLSAVGKSNSSYDKDNWSYNNYRTTFTGFKWLETSGWSNNKLMITEGASISINYAPLAENAVNTGKTIEFELSTTNVSDNDAIVCDLRNDSGTGILITASEASITSAGGSKVSTRYKSEENIRISFVINRNANVANKTLVMMYINGILSGATSYAVNDNFISNKTIRIASTENGTDIALKSIRIYDLALSSNQILNNYILYRDNSEEFLRIYDRNDVYEEGTSDFSTDKLSGQLPIMIITGNIPALEATTDKNLQIDVDVEYINLQDQKRSFTIKNGALRPQGTSSMSYPKKNFRLYTQKKDNTILYDSDGNVVESKLYSFKEGSQPVNCWCFKADYAESSGTHNTGVARLWNEAFKNFQINGDYKGRTNAQKAAISANYEYDVRTCIDGFPILMFYRLDEDSPLVFIGKYNFNNDKSTESVFGFKNIPGFDNSKMQCWEVLNNGHHLALFNDTINWNSEWENAFEGRYPDGNTDATDLKNFATWMSTVRQSDFTTQKWQHLDVYKVAAYYIYLMRFGAVDQVVKNAMFTTEDGNHWYYINYDNDTVNGVRNDGLLIYPPTIDRQTLDDSFTTEVYAYAGHDSRLWNMLEADEEFMSIVREVDNALYIAGLSYDKVIDIFDNKQSNKWCERIYNQDAQYKYIGPFSDRGVNNLFMLQGSRQSHRRWWLSERFALLDAKYVSGEYKANSFEVKLAGAPIGLNFSIKAGVDTYYGYGVNNIPIQYGVRLNKGNSHTFSTTSVLNVGDPLRIYAAPYLEEINISNLAPYIAQISISNVYSERLGSKLRKLVVGNPTTDNNSLVELSGINQAIRLQELDIQRLKNLTTLDLTNNIQLKSLNATNSGLTSLILPKGAPIETLALPFTLQAISLNGLFSLTNEGLSIQSNGANLTTIEILDCPELDTKRIVEDFITYKNAEDNVCSLTINGINWTNVDADWLIRLGNFRSLSLKGTIEITESTEEQLTTLQDIFGNNCFMPNSELFIKTLIGGYIIGPNLVRGNSITKYGYVDSDSVEYTLELESADSLITLEDEYLIVKDISEEITVSLKVTSKNSTGVTTFKRKVITCKPIIYPTDGEIIGQGQISNKGTYEYELDFISDFDKDADYSVNWSITKNVETDTVNLINLSEKKVSIVVDEINVNEITLTASIIRNSNKEVIFEVSKLIVITTSRIIFTKETKPSIMSICYQKGWTESPNYMTEAEAAAVQTIDNAFKDCTDTDFNEFAYFTSVGSESEMTFGSVKSITIPHIEMTFTTLQSILLNNITEFRAINLYKLYNINDNTTPYFEAHLIINTDMSVFDFPVLETIELVTALTQPIIFKFTNPISVKNISFPNLKTYTVSTVSGVGNNGSCNLIEFSNNSTTSSINIPLYTGRILLKLGYNSISYLNLNSATSIYIEETTINNVNKTIDITNSGYFNIKGTESNKGTLEINNSDKLKYCVFRIGNTIKKLNIDGIESLYEVFCTLDVFKDNDYIAEFPNLKNINCITNAIVARIIKIPKFVYADSSINSNVVLGMGNNDLIEYIYLGDENIQDTNRVDVNIQFLNCPNLKSIYLYNTSKVCDNRANAFFENCENLETFHIPNVTHLIRSNYCKVFSTNCPKFKELSVPKAHSNITSSFFINSTIEILETLGPQNAQTKFGAYMQRSNITEFRVKRIFSTIVFTLATKLKTIKCYDKNNVLGYFTDVTVGEEVPEGEEKIIYVPIGATGYDSENWQRFCANNGFTISYTLPTD